MYMRWFVVRISVYPSGGDKIETYDMMCVKSRTHVFAVKFALMWCLIEKIDLYSIEARELNVKGGYTI